MDNFKERGGSRFLAFFTKNFGMWFCYALFPLVVPYYFCTRGEARRGIMGLYNKLGVASAPRQLWAAFLNYHYFVLSMLDKMSRQQGIRQEVVRGGVAPSILSHTGGAILVGAHFGDWSFCGAAFGKKLTRPIAMVINPNLSAKFNQQAKGLLGLSVIDATKPGIEILIDVKRVLDDGGFVCFLADRMGPQARVASCEFLNTPATFPLAPFELALRLKVPIYDFFCLRSSARRHAAYRVSVDEIWHPNSSALDLAPIDLLKRYVATLEKQVRQAPHLWFNFFDFWRKSPLVTGGF